MSFSWVSAKTTDSFDNLPYKWQFVFFLSDYSLSWVIYLTSVLGGCRPVASNLFVVMHVCVHSTVDLHIFTWHSCLLGRQTTLLQPQERQTKADHVNTIVLE